MLVQPSLTWHNEDGAVMPRLRISCPLSCWTSASHEPPSDGRPFLLMTSYSTGWISVGCMKTVAFATANMVPQGFRSDTLLTTVYARSGLRTRIFFLGTSTSTSYFRRKFLPKMMSSAPRSATTIASMDSWRDPIVIGKSMTFPSTGRGESSAILSRMSRPFIISAPVRWHAANETMFGAAPVSINACSPFDSIRCELESTCCSVFPKTLMGRQVHVSLASARVQSKSGDLVTNTSDMSGIPSMRKVAGNGPVILIRLTPHLVVLSHSLFLAAGSISYDIHSWTVSLPTP